MPIPAKMILPIVVAACLTLTAAASSGVTAEPNANGLQSDPCRAARELAGRLLPGRSGSFVFETIPADQGRDVFEIESQGKKIILRGNNGVAMASGLNWYLKYYCQCHYSLKARQLQLPRPLPAVQPKVRRVSQDRWRYFLNYCCFGYSLPWYDWPQWEQLIDWMALNGINAPLSVTGQEAVWLAAGRELGFSDADLRGFFAGPPYLPFGWMGCLDGWGGPLPKSWIDQHADLQRKILARERALGMTPVLQGFTGHVPPATRQRFANARLHTVHWIEWDTLLLDPLDPLFRQFATTFLKASAAPLRNRSPLCRRHLHRDDASERRHQLPRRDRPRDLPGHGGGRSASRVGPSGLDLLQPGRILDATPHRSVPECRARFPNARARPVLRCHPGLE